MDSTELSFVRCPACRSLVPATSNRCRMCGSALEAEAPKKAEEEPKNGSRVRQHTTLGTESEVVQAIEQVREEEAPKAAPIKEEEDPLSQYLEDFDDDNDDDDDEDEELEDILGLSEEEQEEESQEEEVEEEIIEEAPPPPPVKKAAPPQPKKSGLTFKAKESKPEPKREPEPKRAAPAKAAPKKKGTSAPGRLYGWFVSFASPEGAAVELREGRFFITSANVRGADLVLNDDSISSPHALVVIESGLVVQDLVSETGVFVRRAGSTEFKQEIDSVELFHGDSVRFGNVEFIVSLLPDVDS